MFITIQKIYICPFLDTLSIISGSDSPVGKIAQKLDPQIVQYAKTNKIPKKILQSHENGRIVKSVKRTTDRHSVLSVLNISFLTTFKY